MPPGGKTLPRQPHSASKVMDRCNSLVRAGSLERYPSGGLFSAQFAKSGHPTHSTLNSLNYGNKGKTEIHAKEDRSLRRGCKSPIPAQKQTKTGRRYHLFAVLRGDVFHLRHVGHREMGTNGPKLKCSGACRRTDCRRQTIGSREAEP